MIKKLKLKFVLINMCLVGLVLIIAFSIVFYNTYSQAKYEVEGAMKFALHESDMMQNPEIGRLPKKYGSERDNYAMKRKPIHYHVAVVSIMEKGGKETIELPEEQKAYINDDVFEEAVGAARASEEESGWLNRMGLFYKKSESEDVTKIAFADSMYFENEMKDVIFDMILLFILGMITILVISVFLAGMAVEPVKKIWQRHQQFLADASHELKTPLTVILANSDIMLSSENLEEDHKKWLLSTEKEAKHMRNLVDDLLFLARSDEKEGRTQNKEHASLSEIVTGVTLQFEPVIFEAGAELETVIDKNIIIDCDKVQMKQLVYILLDNAVKYTDKGGKITLALRKTPGLIKLEVNNTGSYITPDQLSHVFERFYRSDKARQRDGGYGLGLSIAKTIVEAHGGKIKADSSIQKGTTFTVTL